MALTKKKDSPKCALCDSRQKSVFCSLKESELDDLDLHKTCNVYKKGQTLFHEGNRPLGLYCVKTGKIKIFKTGVDGKEQIIRFAQSGDVVGYRSFLVGEHYAASATTLEDTQVCFIDRDDFKNVLKQNPTLSQNLIQLLGRELREAEDLVRDMAQKSVRERLAEVLLILKDKFSVEDEESGELGVSLTREELASYVGTATETLIRLLSELKEDQIITTKGRKITINKPEVLAEIAGLEI